MKQRGGFALGLVVGLLVGLVLALGVAGCWLGVPSVAQEGPTPPAAQPDASAQPAPVKLTDAEWALRAAAAEKQLRRIRFEHFTKGKPEVRKVGIERLSVFADAPALPALLEVMRDEQDDVRRGVVEHLARLGSDEGLTTLAYAAVHEVDPSFRAMARDKLVSVVRKGRARPAGVDTVIASALEGSEQAQAGRAARLVQGLGILQAIPALIMGQVGGGSRWIHQVLRYTQPTGHVQYVSSALLHWWQGELLPHGPGLHWVSHPRETVLVGCPWRHVSGQHCWACSLVCKVQLPWNPEPLLVRVGLDPDLADPGAHEFQKGC